MSKGAPLSLIFERHMIVMDCNQSKIQRLAIILNVISYVHSVIEYILCCLDAYQLFFILSQRQQTLCDA